MDLTLRRFGKLWVRFGGNRAGRDRAREPSSSVVLDGPVVSKIIFHNRLLKHKYQVMEPELATTFYIPFYVGLAMGKYLWLNLSKEERDWVGG